MCYNNFRIVLGGVIMFINLSNHVSEKWSKEQLETAKVCMT